MDIPPSSYLAELLLVLRHLLQHLGQVSHGGLQGKEPRSLTLGDQEQGGGDLALAALQTAVMGGETP